MANANGNGSAGRKFWEYLSRTASALTLIIGAGLISHEVRLSILENVTVTKSEAASAEKAMALQTKADLREIQTLIVEVRELKVIVRENNTMIHERIRDLERRLGVEKSPDK